MFRTKSESSIYDSVIDPNFIQFIKEKKETIQLDTDQQVLETFDKLDALTATLIKDIDEAYFQHSVELASLSAYTPKPSTIHSESVNSSLFSTTSSIISTTLHSTQHSSPSLPFNLEFYFHLERLQVHLIALLLHFQVLQHHFHVHILVSQPHCHVIQPQHQAPYIYLLVKLEY